MFWSGLPSMDSLPPRNTRKIYKYAIQSRSWREISVITQKSTKTRKYTSLLRPRTSSCPLAPSSDCLSTAEHLIASNTALNISRRPSASDVSWEILSILAITLSIFFPENWRDNIRSSSLCRLISDRFIGRMLVVNRTGPMFLSSFWDGWSSAVSVGLRTAASRFWKDAN